MIIHKEPIKHMPQLCWGSTHKGEDRMRDVHFADMLYQWQNTKITAEDIDIVAEDIDIVKRNPCLSFRQKRQIIKLIKIRSENNDSPDELYRKGSSGAKTRC